MKYSHEEHKRHAFDYFCKKILRNEARDHYDEMKRQRDREVSFSELSAQEMDMLSVMDEYPSEKFNFSVLGQDVAISDELIAQAIAALPEQKRDIILLAYLVSIDDLLSGEELISLAESENRTNLNKIFSLVFGTLDVMTLSFLFLPLYTRQDSDLIRAVSLFANPDVSTVTWTIYLVLPVLMTIIGVVQIIAQHFLNEKWHSICRTSSILLQAFCILAFVATRQSYAITLLFMFFMIKVALLIKSSRIK